MRYRQIWEMQLPSAISIRIQLLRNCSSKLESKSERSWNSNLFLWSDLKAAVRKSYQLENRRKGLFPLLPQNKKKFLYSNFLLLWAALHTFKWAEMILFFSKICKMIVWRHKYLNYLIMYSWYFSALPLYITYHLIFLYKLSLVKVQRLYPGSAYRQHVKKILR